MEKKIIVITGGSSGIGLASGKKFAEEKNNIVILVSRHATKLSNQLNSFSNIELVDVDLRKEDQVIELINMIYHKYKKINLLVNNAGIGIINILKDTSLSEWENLFNSNVTSMFLVTREVIRNRKDLSFLHIINISSEAGIEGFATYSAYCASKFAVTGFSAAIKEELYQENVKVDCVCPGDVKTPFMEKCPIDKELMKKYEIEVLPEKDMLKAEDVANQIYNLSNLPFNVCLGRELVLIPKQFSNNP